MLKIYNDRENYRKSTDTKGKEQNQIKRKQMYCKEDKNKTKFL